jgi:AraC-like DNA-binding protein
MAVVETKTGRFVLDEAFYGSTEFMVYHAWGMNSAARLERHFHDDYVMSVQLRGREHCTVGRRDFCFEAGDMVLINPNQPHTGNDDGADDSEYITLYASREMVSRVAHQLGAPITQPEFTRVHARGDKDSSLLMQDLLSACREESGEPMSSTRSSALARRILVGVLTDHSNMFEPRKRGSNRIGHWRIARVLEHLDGLGPLELRETISLDALAEIAGLSRFHFLRQFADLVGMTPGRYVRMLRLCRAGRQLRRSDDSVLEVALSVGFADHAAFSRAFASQMGITPTNFRRLGSVRSPRGRARAH